MSARVLRQIGAFLFGMCLLAHASAQVELCGKTTVYFGNGVWVDETSGAKQSVTKLEDLLKQRLTASELATLELPFRLANNPSKSGVRDLIEALAQQSTSDYTEIWRWLLGLESLPEALRPYFEGTLKAAIDKDLTGSIDKSVLDEHVDNYEEAVANGKKVLVVAHSQGNFFVNEAYTLLEQQFHKDAFGIVAVASPDTYVAKPDSPHVTTVNDFVITGLVQAERLLLGKRPALLPNTTNLSTPLSTGDFTGHQFIKSYLEEGSSSEDKIAKQAQEALGRLVKPACPFNRPPKSDFFVTPTNTDGVFTFNGGFSFDPDGDIVRFDWDFGDGFTTTKTDDELFLHRYAAPGTYRVKLVVTDNRGATDESTREVTVRSVVPNESPTAGFSVKVGAVSTQQLLVGQEALFDPRASRDPDGEIKSYDWNFGDGVGISTVTPTVMPHTYSAPGLYTATLTVTDDRGATDSIPQTIAVSVPSGPNRYVITELPFAIAVDINDVGQVLGQSGPASNRWGDTPHAFLYSNGSLISFSNLGDGAYSWMRGLNNRGEAVGDVGDDVPFGSFIYRAGVLQEINTAAGLPAGSLSYLVDVNENGHFTGWNAASCNSSIAFVFNGSGVRCLGGLNTTVSFSSSINNLGHVVGWHYVAGSDRRGFLDDGTTFFDLGTLAGRGTTPMKINNLGMIVGGLYIGPFNTYPRKTAPFIYSNGVVTQLGTLGGALGVNDFGEVVGISILADGISYRAFRYLNGVLEDLNSLIDPQSGWVLLDARAINNQGQIVGDGLKNGVARAFLLTPVRGN